MRLVLKVPHPGEHHGHAQLVRVQKEGDGAVVHQVDPHVGPVDPGFHVDPLLEEGLYGGLVEPFPHIGGCGLDKGGAVSLTGVRVKGELAH